MCGRRTWRKSGKDEWAGTRRGRSKKDAADLNFPHLQRLPFSTLALFSPLPRAAALFG